MKQKFFPNNLMNSKNYKINKKALHAAKVTFIFSFIYSYELQIKSTWRLLKNT